jgi:hypothetical protein
LVPYSNTSLGGKVVNPMTRSLALSLRRRLAGGLLPVLAIACAGCSKSGPTLYHVRGQILFEGRPARGATVVFHPVDNSGPNTIKPRAFVTRDGTFEVFTYAAGDGAPAGEYAVTVLGRTGPGPGRPGRQLAVIGKQGQGIAGGATAKRGPGSRLPVAGKRGPGMRGQGAGRRGLGAAPGGGWAPPVELPASYQRPETSDLRIVVQPGDNDLGPLVLHKQP